MIVARSFGILVAWVPKVSALDRWRKDHDKLDHLDYERRNAEGIIVARCFAIRVLVVSRRPFDQARRSAIGSTAQGAGFESYCKAR